MAEGELAAETRPARVSPGEAFKQGRATALIVTTTAGLEGEARRELRRLLPGAETRPLILKGNTLVLADLPEEEALGRIAAADTELVGRVTAVQRRVAITSDRSCFSQVAEAAGEIGRIQPGELFLVRCQRRGQHQWRARELERGVAAALEQVTGAVGEYEKAGDWLVSVEAYQELAYVGVNRPNQLLRKQLRRQRKYPPGERPLNRAQWKLKEALAAFEINLPDGARVLDLGSAPGGWALTLAEMGCRVVAVDRADLDPRVATHPNVEHVRGKAEEVASREEWREKFDLLTCDVNIDPAEAAEVVCRLAHALKAGAPAIMTIKYTTSGRRRHEREARELLARAYDQIHMGRMPHNARETTAVMWRKGGGEAAPN